ncbi:zinc-binding dehydrogenase [Corynebacterium capitovis]|uniref:zinc-binding dehydrogenase n=1 Tax=Corynebacterium capitovis TaxID=131081 RepID=UPI0003A0657C|nr:zinc-binding dehydrogenase [Corynebacterium capitovis]
MAPTGDAADHANDPSTEDLKQRVLELNDGRSADIGFECTSVTAVLDQLIDCLRAQGTLVVESMWSKRAEFDVHALVMKELSIRGGIGYAHTIKLVEEGKVDLKPFITGELASMASRARGSIP